MKKVYSVPGPQKRTVDNKGTIHYSVRGSDRREDGPCRISKQGNEAWATEGWVPVKGQELMHRLDGPAVILSDGSEFWYFEGMIHRMDGPAVILPGLSEHYFIHGRSYRYEDWKRKVSGETE